MFIRFILLFIGCIPLLSSAQHPEYSVDTLITRKGISFRGLSVVNDKTIWVSGSHGTVGRSVDGGQHWNWYTVEGYEATDFRDIEAFDAQTAVIMGIGSPAYILRTTNGGASWRKVYENKDSSMFLDAMHFWNIQSGIVVGDPIGGKLFVTRTFDGGQSWGDIPVEHRPAADSGEAMFAASGTNVRALDLDEAVIVTGGTSAHLYIRDKRIPIPLLKSASAGPNSVAVKNAGKRKNSETLIIVGGDYLNDTLRAGNCVFTRDLGASWLFPATPPFGYRSCIEYFEKNKLITCGTSGVDISEDGGVNFFNISTSGYHVCRRADDGKKVFLAGNGKIGILKSPR